MKSVYGSVCIYIHIPTAKHCSFTIPIILVEENIDTLEKLKHSFDVLSVNFLRSSATLVSNNHINVIKSMRFAKSIALRLILC